MWLCIKIGVGDVPPATFASARLVIALLVLLPVIAFGKAPLPRQSRDWLLIGATGFLLLGLNYAFVYWGAQYITLGIDRGPAGRHAGLRPDFRAPASWTTSASPRGSSAGCCSA